MASVCVCSDYFQVNDDGELCLKPGTMGLRQVLFYKDPGTFQFEKADYPWLARVQVQVQGGGGGSAGADAASNECIVRPGAAGGGWSQALIEVAALGTVETIVVGAGGTGGSGNGGGGTGGMSSFGGFATASGGEGSTAAQSSGTLPDAVQGTTGPLAGTGAYASGGGAGGGGIRLSGTNGLSGAGGESRLGHGGVPRSTEGVGTTPRGYGGGAAGALSYGGGFDGQTGGSGIVVIELYG
ncbi:hypothetical protein [Streptomyces sp. NPDC053560]|uniref:glycine-rich domain-containing protein n=1 Tax=Streptomyces sp. NPDC053560 TaxID=3365711 RepID=UPI0037D5DA78